MAKRHKLSLGLNTNSPKMQQPKDDFWDDDFDCDELDKVFEQATQTIQNESRVHLGETSFILPTYNAFKPPQFSSQMNASFAPKNKVIQNKSKEELERELQDLQQKCLEKEGEVTILRLNMEKTKALHSDNLKKELALKNKLDEINQLHENTKSELAFKKLENLHLKEQIREGQKIVAKKGEQIICQETSAVINNKENTAVTQDKIIINENDFPLKNKDFSYFFAPTNQKNYEKWERYCCGNRRISFIENIVLQEEEKFLESFTKTIQTFHTQEIVEKIGPDLIALTNTSVDELGNKTATEHLHKIIYVCLQIMKDLSALFAFVEDHMHSQEFQQLDTLCNGKNGDYSQRQVFYLGDSALRNKSLHCHKILTFLAEILPFSNYFQNYLFNDIELIDNYDLAGLKRREDFQFFTSLMHIITAIGKFRKPHVCYELLKSTVRFLATVFDCSNYSNKHEVVNGLAKEILFIRPGYGVIHEFIVLMRRATQRTEFNHMLCNNSRHTVQNNSVEFTRETCFFAIFRIQLDNFLIQIIKDAPLFLSYCQELLCIVHNIVKSNLAFLYYSNTTQCKCLASLYKFAFFIIRKNLNHFENSDIENNALSQYSAFFKKAIKVLLVLKHNSYEMMQKSYVDFKGIVHQILKLSTQLKLDENIVNDLEGLNASDDYTDVEIDCSKFGLDDF